MPVPKKPNMRMVMSGLHRTPDNHNTTQHNRWETVTVKPLVSKLKRLASSITHNQRCYHSCNDHMSGRGEVSGRVHVYIPIKKIYTNPQIIQT